MGQPSRIATLLLPFQGAISSGVEHTVDIGGVTGSNPVSPISSGLAWVAGPFASGPWRRLSLTISSSCPTFPWTPKSSSWPLIFTKATGGEVTCSPNQSCEGETPNIVILKDFDGRLVAEISLSTSDLRDLAMATGSSGSAHSHGHGDRASGLASSSERLAGDFCNVVAVLTLIGGLGSALGAMDPYDPDPAGVALGLGAAASSAPIFAIGSIAKSSRRSALVAEQMAELMAKQEERRRATTPDA